MNTLASILLLMAPISLDQAISEGLARHPQLAVADAKLEATQATHRGAKANYGPKLMVEGTALYWGEPQTLEFDMGGGGGGEPLPEPTTPYEGAVAGLLGSLSGLSGVEVREEFTTSFKVQIAQPLIDLYKVRLASSATGAGVEAQRVERELTERGITKSIIEIYLRALQAQEMLKATEASVTHIQAERGRVEALKEAGLVNQRDLLRLKVAEADAQQKHNAAQNNVEQARLALGLAMGVGGAVEVIEALPGWLTQGSAPSGAVNGALEQRLELKLLEQRDHQAEDGVALAKADYLPSLNLIAQYEHTTGSQLQAEHAAFGGVALQWTAFEWGATGAKVDEARAQRRQVEASEAALKQQIAFEVERALRTHNSAQEIVGVAQAAVAQAEEAFRLESARFEADEATATELLAAETALTQARINLTNARFNHLVALNDLRYASGQPLKGAR